MYPALGTGSLILSIVFGVLVGVILAVLLKRLNAWVLAIAAVVALALAPFVGHGTWLVGYSEQSGGEPTQGIHMQYAWTALAVAMALLAVKAIVYKQRTAKVA